MSKKLTLKDKIREGFMCASKMRHYALRLEQDAKILAGMKLKRWLRKWPMKL